MTYPTGAVSVDGQPEVPIDVGFPESLIGNLGVENCIQRPISLALTPAMPQFSLGTS
jgi:hypothetical protein